MCFQLLSFPQPPFIKEFHIFAPLLGAFLGSSCRSRLGQQPRECDSRRNLGSRLPTTRPQSAGVGVEIPGEEWRAGKKLSAVKRSTGQGFRTQRPKRGLTGHEGSLPPRSPGRRRAAAPGPGAPRTRRLLLLSGSDSHSAFPLSSPARPAGPAPAHPRPPALGGARARLATHVLLHFGQVLLGEGRRSGLHGGGAG